MEIASQFYVILTVLCLQKHTARVSLTLTPTTNSTSELQEACLPDFTSCSDSKEAAIVI